MSQTAQITNQVLPILFLIFLGNRLRAHKYIQEETVEELKKIVVNIALPAVLFISFTRIELASSYFTLSLLVFTICLFLFFMGKILQPFLAPQYSYFPFMTTGFEYGMLGVSLFGSAYGLENLGYIAVIDLGHEVFIWFVLLPLLLAKGDGKGDLKGIISTFSKNPVVISIILGVTINLLGLTDKVGEIIVIGAVISALEFLSGLTIPLILIVVGYGIHIRLEGIKDVLKIIIVRYTLIIPIILLFNKYIIRDLFQLGQPFEIALVTLFILPSPFIIPLFMKKGLTEEREYINNVLAMQTIISVVIFSGYVILHPQLV